ncbi:MAG: O-antigen ligase family protein [Desulfarculus sp.]|nr:O-antigen ligase family protein [Desulfarculus sp.]
MSLAAASPAPQALPAQAELAYRLARLFMLTLIVVMPMEAITAAREIGLVGVSALMALHLALSPDRQLKATPLWLPLAIYAATTIISLFTAVDFKYTLKEIRAEVLKGALMYYAAVHFVFHERHLAQCWRALMLCAGIMAGAALILFFTYGGSPHSPFVRAGSLHSGYGAYGTYLVQVWPYLLLAPLAFPQTRWLPLWLGLILLNALAAYLTFSRACWLALVLELGLCLLLLARHRLRNALIVCVACLGILTALFLAPGAHHGERWHKLWENPHEVGGTAGDLLALWRFSYSEIKEHPFRGIGLGRHSFSKAYPDFRQRHQPLLWHAHNAFMDLTLQLGVQGLLAILAVMITLVVLLWPHAPPARGDLPGLFGMATAVMVLGFCLRNLFDDFFVDDNSLFFWLLCGLAMGARGLGIVTKDQSPATPMGAAAEGAA